MAINWNTTPTEAWLILKSVTKAVNLAKENGNDWDLQDTVMDVTACHLNGCPLDLEKLSEFDDFNLSHDVFGIANHMDRETGKLTNHFLPRCAR